MNFKIDVVPQEQVAEQVKGLTEQRDKLLLQIEQLERKHQLIEASLAENGVLTERVKALLAESAALFEEEWKRKSTYYPDIWLAVLEKAAALTQSDSSKK
jgi:hypothetical protein